MSGERVLAGSAGALGASLLVGWFAFPEQVYVWYTPSSGPDVVLPRELGLLLVPLGGVAFGFAALQSLGLMLSASRAWVPLFEPRRGGADLALSVLLAWGVGSTWLVIVMGNAPDRAWGELALTLLAVVLLLSLLGVTGRRTDPAAGTRVG